MERRHRIRLQRGVAVLVAAVGVPILLSVGTLADDAQIREGEDSPRTVIADQMLRIVDAEATAAARATARESVNAVEVFDDEAQAEIIADVRSVFDTARTVRNPAGAGGATRSESAQLEELQARLDFLSDEALRALVDLSSAEIDLVERETVEIAQQLARQRISDGELDEVLNEQLRVELALRSFPDDVESSLVGPIVRSVMRSTVTIDPDETDAARNRAAAEIPDVQRVWRPGEVIVRESEPVDAVEMEALRQSGLVGTDPGVALLRGFAAMAVIVAVLGMVLRMMQPQVWYSGRKALLLASILAGYAALVAAAGMLVDATTSSGWWYAVPAGAMALLAAIMIAPIVGVATMLPGFVFPLVVAPQLTGVAVFVAASVLISVPLATRISSRGDLRSATLRAAVAYPLVAAVVILIFGPRDELGAAALAALLNGLLTAVIVQGLLPFLETLFRLPTVTALLDLADRNHPLLRELERKALGSYNHSVMVASLVERACREIGANALLGNVAALYHDIGKVRQPHFFIENQQGIKNPHDELEPEISAVIIQNHVVDGVEMAREFKLPPEVVACIGSHHGTMIVTYFYRKALDRVGGDVQNVDVDHYRYKGQKPRSKEAGVLVMADCSEAATRSAAMERGTLPRKAIESICDRLIQERVDDGQFDLCDLTFAEMTRVRDAIVEALVGIYHPRIAYPQAEDEDTSPSPDPVAARANG